MVQLGLGTVQFGRNYGVTNTSGQTSPGDAARIVGAARDAGITWIDTASAYGDAEEVLGEILPREGGLRVISKTPDWRGSPPDDAGTGVSLALGQSLHHLRRSRLDGLLVHNIDDLLGERGPQIWDAMVEAKTAGHVDRIGASVYTARDVERLLERFAPDIVQLPISVLDQRLLRSGHLDQLAERGIEVHARSIFLQGVLLSAGPTLPAKVARLEGPVAAVRKASAAAGWSPLQAALAFAKSVTQVAVALVGVTTVAELEAIVTAFASIGDEPQVNWGALAVSDARLVDPRLW